MAKNNLNQKIKLIIKLKIILKKIFEILITEYSNYKTYFLLQILNQINKEMNEEIEEKEDFKGYLNINYLNYISIQFSKLLYLNNLNLYLYSMSNIIELYPINNIIWLKLIKIIKRIELESKIITKYSYYNIFLSFLSSMNIFSTSYLTIPMKDDSTKFIIIDKMLFFEFLDIINEIGPRGILYLLGVRTTIGSIDVLPPHRFFLISIYFLLF